MDKTSQTNKTAQFTPRQLSNFLVLSLLLIVGTFLYISSEQRYKDFVSYQQKLMEKSALDTLQAIDVYFKKQRRLVQLFADAESELLVQLATNPDDTKILNTFRRRIEISMPDYISFTLADATGASLLDEFDSDISGVCLADIKKFSETGNNRNLTIHPNPLQYHFDIMVKINLLGEAGVFFVSFKLDALSELLAISEVGSHELMLLHKNIPGLIELTSSGSRDVMQRDSYLSDAEYEALSIIYPVAGSHWLLAYLPDTNLYYEVQQTYLMEAAQEFLIVLLFGGFMLLFIMREENRRRVTELALLESYQSMEGRVQERTEELQHANEKLQHEIAVRIKMQERLLTSERRYELAAKGAHDGIWELDTVNDRLYFSLRWLEMMGRDRFTKNSSLDSWLKHIHKDDSSTVMTVFEQARKGIIDEIHVEFRMHDKDDLMRWYRCNAATEKNDDGVVIRIAGSLSDVHEHKLAAQQLQHDAFHDMLTGLPNRHVFMDRLGQAVNTRLRDKNYLYAVMFIDLDRFKNVNDSLGHSAGDALLKGVAGRLSICLRPGDTLARLGGDEFVILVNDFKHVGDVSGLAERINKVVAEPFFIESHELIVNASIGIALGTDSYTTPGHLLRDADTAMYRAKNTGTGKYYIFNESIRKDTMARLKIETDLRKALSNDELLIFYQPIIDIAQNSIYGLEALLRWDHPEKGIIQPNDFIPLAEDTGMIVPIGLWVMEGACAQVKEWQKQFPGHDALSLSVNLSCKQFLQVGLSDSISKILRLTKIDKANVLLNLEITETVVMQNASCSTDVLHDLKALGIGLAVDDFGTGYSSLAYLQQFPIDILKIDKQFVSQIDSDADSRAIVNTVIDLAINLGLKVVAEGIEKAEQLQILRDMGCHYAQGYYFSRPVPASRIETMLAEGL